MRSGSARARQIAPLAAVGVVVGHTAAYWMALPDASRRESVLAATGHSYWRGAAMGAAIAGLLAVAAAVVRHTRSALRSHAIAPPSSTALALQLAKVQTALFLSVEAAERLVAHQPLGSLLDHHLLVLGLGAQVVVAAALAGLVAWLARATAAVAARFGRRRVAPTRSASWPLCAEIALVARPSTLAWSIRGPPLLA